MGDDERRYRSVKRSSLGMPPCTPRNIQRRLKRLSLGMPPCIPFSINNHQFVHLHAIFLSLHMLCAMLGASRSLLFSLFQFCLLFITSRNLAYLVWERDTLHSTLEHNIGFHAYLFRVFFIFTQLLSCLALSFHAYLFKSFYLGCFWNSLELSCLSCLESWLVALSCVSCMSR